MTLFLNILKNIHLVWVLRPLEHVVDDVVHLGHKPVQPDLQQHHDGAAHVLPHLGVHVAGQEEQVLDELVNVDHQRLTAPNDELVDAGDGVTPDLGVVVAKKCEKLKARTVMKSFNCLSCNILHRRRPIANHNKSSNSDIKGFCNCILSI